MFFLFKQIYYWAVTLFMKKLFKHYDNTIQCLLKVFSSICTTVAKTCLNTING